MIVNKYYWIFIKYIFIVYLFGDIKFYNFFIILVKHKNSFFSKKCWNDTIWNKEGVLFFLRKHGESTCYSRFDNFCAVLCTQLGEMLARYILSGPGAWFRPSAQITGLMLFGLVVASQPTISSLSFSLLLISTIYFFWL